MKTRRDSLVIDNRKSTIDNSHGAFTLLELLVAVTLLSTVLGITLLRMNGISDAARFQSAANMIASILRVACQEARLSGSPRLLSLEHDSDRIVLREPIQDGQEWRWGNDRDFLAAGGVGVDRLLFAVAISVEAQRAPSKTLRVDAAGRFPDCAVLLQLHGRYAAAILRNGSEPTWTLLPGQAPPSTYEQILRHQAIQPHAPTSNKSH